MKFKLLLLAFCICNLSIQAQHDYRLLLQSGVMMPEANMETFINASPVTSNEIFNGYYYRIIQFNDIPTQADKENISRAGLLLLNYVPKNAFIAAIPASFDKSSLRLLNVHSVIELNAIQKMNRSLLSRLPDYALTVKGYVDVTLEYYKNIPFEKAAEAIRQFQLLSLNKSNHTFNLRIRQSEIDQLAAQPFVLYMSVAGAPPTPDDTKGRSLLRSNVINSDYATGLHFDGSGVSISLADDGAVGPHIDFTGRLTNHQATYGGTHGDMTTGLCVGGGNLDPTKRGMATGATIDVYDIGNYTQIVDALTYYSTIGSVIASTSYSQGTAPGSDCNIYTTDTEFGDGLIHDNPQLLFVFSAGNQGQGNCGYPVAGGWGTITGGYKTGKNVIAVGNLDQSDVLDNTSSRGPLEDGRIKPDICSNGNSQISTAPGNTYQAAADAVFNGTSGACPSLAGITAQLYQAYKSIHGGANPESGLIKASILNTAEDLGNAGPDFTYGYGRVNAGRALKLIQQGNYIRDSISQGQSKTHTITVPPGVSDLRVMLYWMDEAGSAIASQALVNNLDMHLSDPSSLNWNPWVLDPTPVLANITAPAVRGIDSLNNMEQVTVPAALQGAWTVHVDGSSVPMGTQTYYIVYEFRGQDLKVVYPQGGEGFVPGEQEVIRWDGIKGLGNFSLEYTTDGGFNWTLISNTISQNTLQYAWTVPATVTGQACIRLSRGGFVAVSDTLFSIIGVPQNIQVDYACVDSLQLSWNPVGNATGYAIYKLGSKYMEIIGTSSTTNFTVAGTNPLDEYWFSVGAITADNTNGRRAIAINKQPGVFNCQLTNDVELSSIVSPVSGTVTSCLTAGNTIVTVNVVNNGVNAISNFPINYSDGVTTVMDTVTATIPPNGNLLFSFTVPLNYAAIATYNLTVWIQFPGDQNIYNDTLKLTTNVISGTVAAIPFVENFDAYATCSNASDCGVTVCNFGNGWINQTNITEDDIDFRVSAGSTPSANTGPDVDHTTGTTTGHYIYLEASGCFSSESKLLSPCLDLTTITGPEVSFWYHMFGTGMGELHLDVFANGSWTDDVMTPISGNKGNQWLKQVVPLTSYAGQIITLRFRGITGIDFTSDLALDDINLIETNIAPVAAFIANYTSSCVGSTVKLTDKTSFNPTTWQWTITPGTFSFVSGTNANSQNPQVQFSAIGTYDVKLKASNSFGNDSTTSTSYINIISPSTISLVEDFEGAVWPPVAWRVESAGNIYTWEHVQNITGMNGAPTKAAKINNFDYFPIGGQDGLTRLEISLAGAIHPIMTFERAYTRASANPVDGLRIDVSTDCGTTYVPSGYLKQGALLATTGILTTPFTPSTLGQWRKDTLDLTAWIGQDISLKFVNISGSSNNLYLDNINIGEFSGVSEAAINADVNIFPNPSSNGIFNISINGLLNQSAIFRVTDVQGKIIEERKETINGNYKSTIDLHQNAKGSYFFEIRTEKGVSRFRLSVM